MPRADDLPSFKVGTKVTPCTHNPLGAKGCGEAGAIGAPAAVMNAVIDALAASGVKHLDMPASPHRVWQRDPGGRSDAIRETTMYAFELTAARRPSRTPPRRSRKSGGKALAGGQSLVARDEAAARAARHARRSRRHRRAAAASSKDGDALVIGAMTRHAEVAASADGARARSRRWPRWPRASATARCATWARSAARSPTTIRRPTSRRRCSASARRCITNKRKIAADDFFKGMYETALARRRDHHRGQLPGAEEGRVREVPAIPRRASRWSACSSRRRDGGVRVAVTGAGAGVFRVEAASRTALAKSFTADAAKASRSTRRVSTPTCTARPSTART